MKKLLLIFIITLLSCDKDEEQGVVCIPTNCSNYSTQAEAQAAYNLNRTCRSNLDRDNDGIACEQLRN